MCFQESSQNVMNMLFSMLMGTINHDSHFHAWLSENIWRQQTSSDDVGRV